MDDAGLPSRFPLGVLPQLHAPQVCTGLARGDYEQAGIIWPTPAPHPADVDGEAVAHEELHKQALWQVTGHCPEPAVNGGGHQVVSRLRILSPQTGIEIPHDLDQLRFPGPVDAAGDAFQLLPVLDFWFCHAMNPSILQLNFIDPHLVAVVARKYFRLAIISCTPLRGASFGSLPPTLLLYISGVKTWGAAFVVMFKLSSNKLTLCLFLVFLGCIIY